MQSLFLSNNLLFEIMFALVAIVSIVIIVFVFMVLFSPKARARMISKQIQAQKMMLDESKEDLAEVNTMMANASKEGIKITTKAIKDGFTEDDKIYCKHCGFPIDADSEFCKKCGKKQ